MLVESLGIAKIAMTTEDIDKVTMDTNNEQDESEDDDEDNENMSDEDDDDDIEEMETVSDDEDVSCCGTALSPLASAQIVKHLTFFLKVVSSK